MGGSGLSGAGAKGQRARSAWGPWDARPPPRPGRAAHLGTPCRRCAEARARACASAGCGMQKRAPAHVRDRQQLVGVVVKPRRLVRVGRALPHQHRHSQYRRHELQQLGLHAGRRVLGEPCGGARKRARACACEGALGMGRGPGAISSSSRARCSVVARACGGARASALALARGRGPLHILLRTHAQSSDAQHARSHTREHTYTHTRTQARRPLT